MAKRSLRIGDVVAVKAVPGLTGKIVDAEMIGRRRCLYLGEMSAPVEDSRWWPCGVVLATNRTIRRVAAMVAAKAKREQKRQARINSTARASTTRKARCVPSVNTQN